MVQQRFLELITKEKTYTSTKEIEFYLSTSDFYWLLECEVDYVKIEITDNILYWNSGIFYWGIFYWGIWKTGEFRSGIWKGGIFYNGTFNGTWIRGVEKGGTINKKNKIAND
jgi:hypothetical protein